MKKYLLVLGLIGFSACESQPITTSYMSRDSLMKNNDGVCRVWESTYHKPGKMVRHRWGRTCIRGRDTIVHENNSQWRKSEDDQTNQ